MTQYRIFKHPAGKIEAVKQGWSWPGMFFTFIWAFVKSLWQLGTVVLVLALLAGVVLDALLDEQTVDILSNVIGIIIALLFGLRGNIWRENHLLSRGFEHVDTIAAGNPEGAIAVYLKPDGASQGADGEPPASV